MKPGACSLRKINKIDKALARLARGHRDSIQISKIRNGKGDTTTEIMDIQKIKSLDPTTKAYTNKTGKPA